MRILFDQNARGPGQRIATQDAKTIERNDAGPFCPVHVALRRVVRLTSFIGVDIDADLVARHNADHASMVYQLWHALGRARHRYTALPC